ncbi:hypothetical protein NCS52_00241900 [Fusarium sp. LHS14.1]|nr:hypothetical protein NCS52_00241900 [Fusarium sp. LHS14.1]
MVEYTLYPNKTNAIHACVNNYDASQIDLLGSYNRAYLVALGRRRVVHFVAAGTAQPPEIRNQDLPTKTATVVLARPYLAEMTGTLSDANDLGPFVEPPPQDCY